MKVESEKILKIEFKGEDSDLFKSIIKKVNDSWKVPGFNRAGLEEKDYELLQKLNTELEKL